MCLCNERLCGGTVELWKGDFELGCKTIGPIRLLQKGYIGNNF